jgi:hypothetical protein
MSRQAEPGLDRESREWMDGLRSAASERDAVLARVHGLLLHVACQEAARRIGWLRLSGPDRDDLARQAAAGAREAITTQLDGFRGQSRFRTWASTGRDLAYLSGAPWTGPPWLDDLLTADPGDGGYDPAFHVLDRYAEAELNGTSTESRFPGVAVHLRRCEACHQDYRGLLAAVGQRARPAREITVMGASQISPRASPSRTASALELTSSLR